MFRDIAGLINCVGELSSVSRAVVALLPRRHFWCDVVADVMHLEILTEDGVPPTNRNSVQSFLQSDDARSTRAPARISNYPPSPTFRPSAARVVSHSFTTVTATVMPPTHLGHHLLATSHPNHLKPTSPVGGKHHAT
jgi:hypothetical protein